MWDALLELALVALGVGAAVAVVAYWDEIREAVASWLRNNGYDKSFLMDAWVKLDTVASAVRSRLFVRTRQLQVVMIEEKTYDDISEIDDESLREEFRRRGCADRNVMSQIH